MIYYDYCDTACRYLKGDIWGIDLKWVGSAYMAAIIVFAAFKQTPFVRVLLASGLGVEVFLFSFQVQNDVFCPFCLTFAVIVIAAFIINYEVPSAWYENRRRMWRYFLGEVDLPMFKIHKLPLLIVSIIGYLVILLTFSGSVTPSYAQDVNKGIPSLGKGNNEILFFTDYFCPPCQELEKDAEPLIKELLASGRVKVTFIDVPAHKPTPIFAKYYLYAVNYAGTDQEEILSIRKTLFHAAKKNSIKSEDGLVGFLREMKINWTKYDDIPVLVMLSNVIKQNKVDITPTCIIKRSTGDVKKYVGTDEVRDGLTKLKEHLAIRK
jgi:thiol:disulfide interchange protein DsbA